MADFKENKSLASIGSILLCIPMVDVVGLILLLISSKHLAEHYKDVNIFRNFLSGGISGIIGSSVSLISLFLTLTGVLDIAILLLMMAVAFSLMSVLYYRKALNALAGYSGVNLFRTAGTLLLVGAIMSIIFIGVIFTVVGLIFLAFAFSSIKEAPQTVSSPSFSSILTTQPITDVTPENSNSSTILYSCTPSATAQLTPTVSNSDIKIAFCPKCGTHVFPEAVFCVSCGKHLLGIIPQNTKNET